MVSYVSVLVAADQIKSCVEAKGEAALHWISVCGRGNGEVTIILHLER